MFKTGKYLVICLLLLLVTQFWATAKAQEDIPSDGGGFLPMGQPAEPAPPAEPGTAVLATEWSVLKNEVVIGEVVTTTLTVSNSGSVLAENVQVGLTLPAGLTFLNSPESGFVFNETSGEWEQLLPQIEENSSWQTQLVWQIEAAAPPELTILAYATNPQNPDFNLSELIFTVVDGQTPAGLNAANGEDGKGAWQPTFNQPVVNTFAGGVGYNYPMALPPGRNGLQPSLNLSYSSKSVDGLLGWYASDWVGLGWSIDQIDIVRNGVEYSEPHSQILYKNEFNLVLNGTSYRLVKADPATNDGRYYAENGPELYIERVNDCNGNNSCYDNSGGSPENVTHEYFIVRSPSGTTYRLGYTTNSEQVLGNVLYTPGAHPYAGNLPGRVTYRFRVDQITDVHGNRIVYTYNEYSTADGLRDIASYLQEIKYNETTPGSNVWLTKVVINATTNINQGSYYANDKRLFITRQRLDSVRVYWENQLTREYHLGYNSRYTADSGVVYTLKTITEYGHGGWNSGNGHKLPAVQFTYQLFNNKEQCHPGWPDCQYGDQRDEREREGFAYERLVEVQNGYGGRVVFAYQNDGRHGYWGLPYSYRVTTKTVYDGLQTTPVLVESYEYGIACYNQTGQHWPVGVTSTNCPQPDTNDIGTVMGHDWVKVKQWDGATYPNSTPLQMSQHFYRTNKPNQTAYNNWSRLLTGKEYETRFYDGSGTKLLSKNINEYHASDGTSTVADGNGNTTAGNGCPSHTTLLYFTCLVRSRSYQHVPYDWTNQAESHFYTTSHVTYGYDMGMQGGAQYGNRTTVTEYHDNTPFRTQRTWYVPNTTPWLVNLPVNQTTYEGTGWTFLSGQWFYYDGQSLSQPPLKGNLSRVRQLQEDSCNGVANCAYAYKTIESRLYYHATYKGNVVTQRSYSNYGSVKLNSGWVILSGHDVMANQSKDNTTSYDSFGLFPVQMKDALQQTSTVEYNQKLPWLPKRTTSIDGNEQWLEYDPFGRLFALYDTAASRGAVNSNDAWDNTLLDGDPVVRYGYWDNSWNHSQVSFLPTLGTGPFMVSTVQRPQSFPMPTNSNQYAYNDQVFYDGLGRVIQTRSIWSDVAENNHRENETFTLTQYDALGRMVCQTTPFRADYFTGRAPWPANPVLQNVACTDRPHSTTSYNSFSQPTAVTQPNNQISQTLYGLRTTYGMNEIQQWAGQYSDVAGRLAGVDESNRPEGALEDNFASSNNLNSNWPLAGLGGSGSRTVVNGELDIYQTSGNGSQYGVTRPVAISNPNDDEGVSLKFKVSHLNNGLTWLSLESGTWNSSNYRLWGLLIEGGQLKLQEWQGTAETKTNLMPIQANQWYQVVLKVSKNSSRTFSVVVWEENNPANMAEIQRSKASNWVMQDWKFTAKTNIQGNHLTLDNYVEREFFRTTYGYDAQSNLSLVSKTNSSGNNVQTTMTYNQFGQKVTMIDPDMGSWSYGYDPAGNLTSQTNSSNQTLCFYYDKLSRLTFKAELNSGVSCPADSTSGLLTSLASYTYSTSGSSAGKLSSVTWRRDNSSDGETFGYDDRGRLTNHTRTLLGRTYQMEYGAFDVFNRPGTIKYSSDNNLSGTILTPSYDKEGENGLKEGSSWLVSDVQYNVQGQMTYFNRSSASAKDSTFFYADQTGNFRLMGIQHGVVSDEVSDYSYSYDPAGNITQITEQVFKNGVTHSLSQSFGYDKLSRLVTAQSLGNSNLGVLSYNHLYRYDKLGNMTQWQNNGVMTTYNYTTGRPHAVSSTSGGVTANFGYDPQGNMNSRTQNGVSYVQGFDKENRLISVTTNGQTTLFKYDASGQRTMTLAPNGLYTFYPFPNVEEEVNLNNQDYTLKYTYSSAGAAVGVRTKAKQGVTTTNTLHYLYSDHLGSTSVVTNASGGQVQQTRFLPFGGYWGTPTQTVTDRGYTGHLHNDEVGLIYMNARFYVPAVGRFASADTIVPNPTNPQAFNRYSYTYNNPIRYTDPSGHCIDGITTWACLAAAAVITLKVIDYGMTAYDTYTAGQIINDPNASYEDKFLAALNVALAIGFEALEPDDATPISLPVDDLARRAVMEGMEEAMETGGIEAVQQLVKDTLGDQADEALAYIDEAIGAACSFSEDTLVTTENGQIAIAEVEVGTMVLAYNEATGEVGYYPVIAVWSHLDPLTVYLTINGEQIETTPEHPFYTSEGEWKPAATLQPWDKIRQADGSTGEVESVRVVVRPQEMYNFTVATAHTYFVGEGQWLVHNFCWGKAGRGEVRRFIDEDTTLKINDLEDVTIALGFDPENILLRPQKRNDYLMALMGHIERRNMIGQFTEEIIKAMQRKGVNQELIDQFIDMVSD